MAEIIVGALLLRRLIGPNARMDRVAQVGGMLVALGVATAISATAGTVSMVAGGVIDESDATEFWRTWWLGDSAGGLVVLPLMLAWAQDPLGAWRRIRTWEGAAVIAGVTALGIVAVSTEEPITYMVFPALIWAAFRLGPPGATLSIAITAGVAIGVTAHDLGPFFKQPIDHRTLSTQLYIGVAALTTLFLSVVVSERERSSLELAEARRSEGERAVEERRRIARDLHDSVSQALFSTVLHTRTAEKALVQEGGEPLGTRRTIARHDRGPHQERAGRDSLADLRAAPRPRPRRAGCGTRQTRLRAGRSERADHRRPRARAAGCAIRARGNAAVRHRAGGACECPEARRSNRGAGPGRGSAGTGARRGS